MTFSEKLKQAMQELHLNQRQVCGMTGKSKGSVSQYLSGKQIPSEDVQSAIGILTYNPRYASSVILKLLNSAVANAENNNNMDVSKLYIAECYANAAPTMKRIKPRAQGRAYRILKRNSHITLVLDER